MSSMPMLTSEIKASILDTIVELNESARDIRDYRKFPAVLESHLKTLFTFDWLGLYVFGQGSAAYRVVTSPSMPYTWDEKYAEFFNLDTIRIDTLNADVGGTLIFEADNTGRKEEEVYFFETVKKYIDASNFLSLHCAKTPGFDAAICLYRSDENHVFSTQEKQMMEYLSPILGSFTHTMVLYSEFDFKRVSVDKLAGTQKALSFTLNDRLDPVDIPKATELFIDRHFPSTGRQIIPKPIDHWIRHQIATKGYLEPNSGPWVFRMRLPELDLYCKAYAVLSELRQMALLVMMIPHDRPMDFSILRSEGLTEREIETISYLPLGYSNKQIAMAMEIEEVTVKKHLKNSAQKLGTAGKTDTLYKIIQKKELLETLHIC